jgi:hypothetical protein
MIDIGVKSFREGSNFDQIIRFLFFTKTESIDVEALAHYLKYTPFFIGELQMKGRTDVNYVKKPEQDFMYNHVYEKLKELLPEALV